MFNDVLFFMYIFAGFAGVLAIIMVVLLIRHWSSGNKRLLAAIRNFTVCTALIDFLYFYFEYQKLSHDISTSNFIVRIADICFFIGQIYFWCAYIREKSTMTDQRAIRMKKITTVLIIICVVSAVAVYGFLMDGYYIVRMGPVRTVAIVLETVISVLLTFVNIWHLKAGIPEVVQKKSRRYIILLSVMLIINGVWNGFIVDYLIFDRLDFVTERIIDPTSVFILIINILTILLITSEDFSALFRTGDDSKDGSLTARLDYIAETHMLTKREREIMELAYMKMTNPEIADKLYISKYTVKNHMHSIFEKLDISTRSELILFVDREDNGKQSFTKK